MFVLGINGSPRRKGNSQYLMSLFIKEMEEKGYQTRVLDAAKLDINACIGCGICEKKGACMFKDEFTTLFLPAVIRADIIVISSPVYFYAFPAKLTGLINRTQVLWSRKYRLKINDDKDRDRKGVLLAVGATKGKDLFDGMDLTARYFFDAADIKYDDKLFFRGIDEKGEMEKHSRVHQDMKLLCKKY